MDIVIANLEHIKYAEIICKTIDLSARDRGTGIAIRTTEYITEKIRSGNSVIALDNGKFAGFCYIETFSNKSYVAHSGLIVHFDYRKQGLAKKIKSKVFNYSKTKYPDAKIFELFADKNSGVTRNVIIDKKGNIAHLTRLFNMEEFNTMVEKIKLLLKDDGG